MLIAVTSIELRSPLKFFGFSLMVFQILQQIKTSQCLYYKTSGLLLTHFTITAWENETQMNSFSRNNPHLAAMKKSPAIAKEIRILSFEADSMPDWKMAKKLLYEKGKVLSF